MNFRDPIISAICLTGLFACKAKKTVSNECATFLVTYNSDIKNIIDINCANSCHSATSRAAGIDLSTFENVKTISNQARFLGAIKHHAGYSPMPKKAPKLDDNTIQKLSCWVAKGSPE